MLELTHINREPVNHTVVQYDGCAWCIMRDRICDTCMKMLSMLNIARITSRIRHQLFVVPIASALAFGHRSIDNPAERNEIIALNYKIVTVIPAPPSPL